MSTEQAYAPPDSGAGPSGPRAGFGHRLGAALIDGLLLGLVSILLAYALEDSPGLYAAVSTLVGVAYYVALEGGRRGQTLGKRALNIRVIALRDGRPIGYARALVRYIGRIFSTIPLFLGYFWMLWDSEKQTWHDKLASAVVVPTDAYPVD
jgi:uncharacterized RDD family membrane protein YckC